MAADGKVDDIERRLRSSLETSTGFADDATKTEYLSRLFRRYDRCAAPCACMHVLFVLCVASVRVCVCVCTGQNEQTAPHWRGNERTNTRWRLNKLFNCSFYRWQGA